MQAMLLPTCYAMPGTDIGYAPTRWELSLSELLARADQVYCPISLRASCAMSGTDIPYGIRACYTVSSTDIISAYARATQCPVLIYSMRYARATECPVLTHCMRYARATQCPVLICCILLRDATAGTHKRNGRLSGCARAMRCPVLR
eukprot:3931916-Rhodomonas_salina.3